MAKTKKRTHSEAEVEGKENAPLPAVRHSDEPVGKKAKWINKQRVLVFASRGISHRDRHLMEDLKKIMPHHKPEAKMERSKTLSVINEMCEMKNCNKAMMFEGRRKKDLYMWLSNVPNGPSVKFFVENVYTMSELKLTGNCLRGSRPILSFDPIFMEKPHYTVLKELLTQVFGVPKHHPKSQPFFDHVYTFTILDNRVWFRNYQILSEDGALAEVGPRFVLNPVKIFSGSFGGAALWENPTYTSPAKYRQQLRISAKDTYLHRMQQKAHAEATRPTDSYKLTPMDDIFKEEPLTKALHLKEDSEKAKAQGAQVKKKVKKVGKKHKVTHLNGGIVKENKGEKIRFKKNKATKVVKKVKTRIVQRVKKSSRKI